MKKRFVDILKNPPIWLLVITFIIAVISITMSLVFSLIDFDAILFKIITYIFYAVALVSMAYSIYTFVYIAPRARSKFLQWADKREVTRQIVSNFGVRTIIFAIGSFALSIAYGAYNFTLSILEMSVWYGVLAAYYILLASMRGGVITYHEKKRKAQKCGKIVENEKVKGIKRYRNCGIMLIVMTFALMIAVLQMVLVHRSFTHTGMMIYVSAAYTFYKVTMSIVNIVKAKKQTDVTVQAIRNINLADAMVSILALQTSMINSFGGSEDVEFADALNGATGAVVCLLIFALGIFMIAKAKKQLRIESQNENGTLSEENAGREC
ncbi:MAG: hypothetical protein K2L70_01205 [Clostridia bacterium]|nr:hypothetical protein [Clostridia bacterium]